MAPRQEEKQHQQQEGGGMSYWRFGAMIATSVVLMYGVMYLNTYALAHVQWSESRVFMALTMGGVMALVMLGYMLSMYRNRTANLAIVVASLLLIAVGVFLDRSQTTVEDVSFMSAMIPHHSIAILRSERAEIEDVRVCRLAVEISEAQRREIAEMEWLISDIEQNGLAETAAAAEARPVPDFEGEALRDCPQG
jgi:uncharacterized protein (DUF305 family)